jgi:hypothetical protein
MKPYYGGNIKEADIGGECNWRGGYIKSIQKINWKHVKRPLGRHRSRWVNNNM